MKERVGPLKDNVDFMIRFNGKEYVGICIFDPSVTREQQGEIEILFNKVLKKYNNQFDETEYIDIVVLIHAHGCVSTSKKTVVECEFVTTAKNVSILEAVPCGIINVTDELWHIEAREMYDEYRGSETFPSLEFIQILQTLFRKKKQIELKEKKGAMHDYIQKELESGDTTRIEKLNAFRRIQGWNLHTSKRFVNRHYRLDPKWEFSFVVIEDTKGHVGTGTQLKHHIANLNRKELVEYLFSLGYVHPLIIDNSCAGIYAESATSHRYTVRSASKSGKASMGGKRKSMKRPKIKKFIHFS